MWWIILYEYIKDKHKSKTIVLADTNKKHTTNIGESIVQLFG